MEKTKIAAIVGSLRKESYNRQLAQAAKRIVGSSAEFELLEFSDVPLMNQDIEYPPLGPVKRVREIVKASDGIWIFTPEYNHSFPGVLKNLIDWLSRPESPGGKQVLSKKPVAISGISPGTFGTVIAQDYLVALLSLLNMKIMNYPRLTISNAEQQLDSRGRLELGESAPFLEKQAKAFMRFVQNN